MQTDHFCATLLKIGPAMSVTGMAIIIPYNNTSPTFAFNSLAITTGPGCGGKSHVLLTKLLP